MTNLILAAQNNKALVSKVNKVARNYSISPNYGLSVTNAGLLVEVPMHKVYHPLKFNQLQSFVSKLRMLSHVEDMSMTIKYINPNQGAKILLSR